jgi:threonine aldolase
MKYIDLRSDTVTKPSNAMREAMMRADVGDDVFGEDSTVNTLQERVARMFGKEAALFVPSGTMGNEICIKAHTVPGDEIIVDRDSHVFVYETAAPALLAGVQMQPLAGERGVFTVAQLKSAVRPAAYYMPRTKLICLENTHGRSGGSIVPIESIREVHAFAREHGILLHLDGARIWNAHVETGIALTDYAQNFDSISVCFSKGLGAPVGSMILGSREFIDQARRYRKIFGGGMRQVGILAAGAQYAIEHNIVRLKEDHAKAKFFAQRLCKLKKLKIERVDVETNMVMADISQSGMTQEEALLRLKSRGVLLTPERQTGIRAVMHMDVSMNEVRQASEIVESIFS